MDMIPECYIPKKEMRDLRDLVRRRHYFVNITAMSLSWGGLNDVGPKPSCLTTPPTTTKCNTLWHTPHTSHKNGKEVDIGVSNLGAVTYKLLLRQVILDNHYGDQPTIAHCEGDINLITPVQACTPITHSTPMV